MGKRCELCKREEARVYCESDSANLCWECDERVHSANFLVERHLRHLLCHVCALPTSWSASGTSLGRTLSVCHPCVGRRVKPNLDRDDDCVSEDDDYCSDDDDSDDDDDDDVEDEQVVPSQMSSTGLCLKRRRGQDHVHECSSDDDYGSSSSYRNAMSFSAKDNGSVCVDSVNPYKRLQTQSDPACTVQFESTSLNTSAKNVETVISETCSLDSNALAIGSESADS